MRNKFRCRGVGSGGRGSGIGGFLGRNDRNREFASRRLADRGSGSHSAKKKARHAEPSRTSQNWRPSCLLLNFLGLAVPLHLAVLLVHPFHVLICVTACRPLPASPRRASLSRTDGFLLAGVIGPDLPQFFAVSCLAALGALLMHSSAFLMRKPYGRRYHRTSTAGLPPRHSIEGARIARDHGDRGIC